jgi:hypothetical protein
MTLIPNPKAQRPAILGKLKMEVPESELGSPWMIHPKFLEGIQAESFRLRHRVSKDEAERVILTLLGIERKP